MSQRFKETETKRTFLVPSLLLIILLSVMGNVVLYSKMISYKQEERAARGISIIEAGMSAKEQFAGAAEAIQALLADEGLPARMEAKSQLAAVLGASGHVELFIAEAEKNNEAPFAAPRRDAAAFFEEVRQGVAPVGVHEGKLTGEERQYLQMLQEAYLKFGEIVKPFDYSEKTKTTTIALTIQAGGSWVGMAEKLVAVMNEPDKLK